MRALLRGLQKIKSVMLSDLINASFRPDLNEATFQSRSSCGEQISFPYDRTSETNHRPRRQTRFRNLFIISYSVRSILRLGLGPNLKIWGVLKTLLKQNGWGIKWSKYWYSGVSLWRPARRHTSGGRTFFMADTLCRPSGSVGLPLLDRERHNVRLSIP